MTMPVSSKILDQIAKEKAGIIIELDKKIIEMWKVFHESLKPVKILIPFAKKIVDIINQNKKQPLSIRRAFKRVMSLIDTIVCCYQHQRTRDSKNRVIAEIQDYWMAYQIVEESFKENMTQQSKKIGELIEQINKTPIMVKQLSENLGLSKSIISNRAKKIRSEGIIFWCTEVFQTKELNKAKRSGKAFLRISDSYKSADINVTGLPTPYQLTNNSAWDIGGELYKKYDLKLDDYKNSKPDKMDEKVASDEEVRSIKNGKVMLPKLEEEEPIEEPVYSF